MTHVGWVEGLGYVASLLVVAIVSNIAFMLHGLAGGIYPVFVSPGWSCSAGARS